jgi:N-acyl-D-amino-acid deacylase
MFDLLFRNARVIDGVTTLPHPTDVGIKNGRIAEILQRIEGNGKREIDVSGRVLSPGFIDMHSHSDLMLIKNPHMPQKIRQGITTEVLGQDGIAPAPVPRNKRKFWIDYLRGLDGDIGGEWPFESVHDYRSLLDGNTPTNTATLIPHGAIRLEVLGLENREATAGELREMKSLVENAMDQGARGLSTGLIYMPCIFSPTSELRELCKLVARRDGIFVVHMRNEGGWIFESLDEVIDIGRQTGVPVHISHLGAQSRKVWGLAAMIVEKIDRAREEGIDVTCDQYPYLAGSTLLSALLPPWAFEQYGDHLVTALGKRTVQNRIKDFLVNHTAEKWDSHFQRVGPENIRISSVESEGNKQFQGKSLPEVAEMRGEDIFSAVLNILVEEELRASMVVFLCIDQDVETIMKAEFHMFCTDGLLGGFPHPRVYGAFPRVLGRYVREKAVLDLETAVRKMTAVTAQRLGLTDRGRIKKGFHADITVFDADRIIDRATYDDPVRFPEGIEYVVVNGEPVLDQGEQRLVTPGQAL